MVVSQVNVTLASMQETNSQPQIQTDRLVDVGNLVYSYDLPSDPKNSLRPKKDSSESNEDDDDDNDSFKLTVNNLYNTFEKQVKIEKKTQQNKLRNRRSTENRNSNGNNNKNQKNNRDDYENAPIDFEQDYYQPKPTLKYAPENPLLNYFIGNKGHSIQNEKEFNAQTEVQKLAEEIGQDLSGDVSEVPVKQTLRKFNVLAKIIRTMNADKIEETTRYFDGKDQKTAEKSRKVYRDALLSAGTGPAITELMRWIEEGKLKGEEAAELIASFPKTIREPTEDMQQRFFVSWDFITVFKEGRTML